MSGNADVPVTYVMTQLDELKAAVGRLTEKIDNQLGDHATRLTRLEVEREHHQRQLAELQIQHQRQIAELQKQLQDNTTDHTHGRRWGISTVIAVIAVLVSIAAVAAAILGG